MTALWIVTGVLSICVLALSVIVAALARQIGILHERSAPLGALVTRNTQDIRKVPSGFWETLSGDTIALPLAENRDTLLMFVSTTCPVCKKLLPIIDDIRRLESKRLDFVFASDGNRQEHEKFYQRYKLSSYPYILSAQLGKQLAIDHLPYMVLVKANGDIASRGLVNSREQIESLITAMEVGHPTIQSLIASQNQHSGHQGHEHHEAHV